MALVPAASHSAEATSLVTLTDAQIKALPSTPVEVVATPGANRLLVAVAVVIRCDAAAGAYTNISASADPFDRSVFLTYSAGDSGNATVYADAQPLLGSAAATATFLAPYATVAPGGEELNSLSATTAATYLNQGLFLIAYNADGNYTGGNLANSMSVAVAYISLWVL